MEVTFDLKHVYEQAKRLAADHPKARMETEGQTVGRARRIFVAWGFGMMHADHLAAIMRIHRTSVYHYWHQYRDELERGAAKELGREFDPEKVCLDNHERSA